jgi:hypothetical protein
MQEEKKICHCKCFETKNNNEARTLKKQLKKRCPRSHVSSTHTDSSGITEYLEHPFCDNCGIFGHYEINCWYTSCEFCGKYGHIQDVCYKYKLYLKIKILEAQLEEIETPDYPEKPAETGNHDKKKKIIITKKIIIKMKNRPKRTKTRSRIQRLI